MPSPGMLLLAGLFAIPASLQGATIVRPTPQQSAWQDLEYGMFCHFGPNTFHNLEWGDGTADPKSFYPTHFDANQWVAAAKAAGMKYLVVTAKHHDGFCLFQTKYTDYGVRSSPWRDGKGDVVKEVADACHKQGLKFGFYLSPWDRHDPSYADSKKYDEHFMNQLTELLTNYGEVTEVWFDGAGSAGHVYNWGAYYSLIRKLQPHALIAICGPDIRWVGNEDGLAPATLDNLAERDGKKVWYPAECDVPIRSGWFWHTDSESSIKSLDHLLDIYHRSVGHGANLLLNVAPDNRGLIPDADIARLRELRTVIDANQAHNLALNRPIRATNTVRSDPSHGASKAVDGDSRTWWAAEQGRTRARLEVDLGGMVTFNQAISAEMIDCGQAVRAYRIEAWDGAKWREVCRGTTIGHKKIDLFDDMTASNVRLSIISADTAIPAGPATSTGSETPAKPEMTIREFGVYYRPTK